MTFVANLPKLWRTFQFCGEPSCGEPSLWRTFLIPLLDIAVAFSASWVGFIPIQLKMLYFVGVDIVRKLLLNLTQLQKLLLTMIHLYHW